MEDKRNNKKERSGLPTYRGLIFRTVAGAYLVYLAYSIFSSSESMEGTEKIAFAAVIAAFAVIGAAIVISSLRAMQKGEYEGGAGDHRKASEEEKKKEASETKRIRFGEPETLPEEGQKEPENKITDKKGSEGGNEE